MKPAAIAKKAFKLAGKKKYSAFLAKYWPYLVAAIVLIALIILLVWLIRRRRRQRAAAGEPTTVARPALNLKRSWKRFLKGIPYEYRRSVVLYQPYVVIGSAGSGKSSLIDRCTDWRGQAAQFHPSYTDDPLVQFYQGSGVVVEELSVAVLADVSNDSRRALRALWKPLLRGKTPEVVVVLDAASLQTDPPDVVAKHAQLVRGKINILSQLLGRPVKTSIALTHMDQLEGYSELSSFLRRHGRAPEIDITVGSDLRGCLESYEEQLPLALTSQPASGYLKIASFLARAPELLTPLSAFVQVLQSPDPTTAAPELTQLTLSSTEDGDEGANPLRAAITADDISAYRPLRKHRWAAAGIAVAGLCLFGGAFLRERTVINEAGKLADELTDSTSPYQKRARQRFFDYVTDRRDSLASSLLPTFRASHDRFYKQAIFRRYLDGVRQRVLYPRLKAADAATDGERERRVLYYLALIYGTKQNGLGKKILAERDHWEQALDLPGQLIVDYLEHNPGKALEIPLDLRRFDRSFKLVAHADYGSAALFFQQLARAEAGPVIDRQTLAQLLSKAKALLVDVADVDRNREVLALLDLLEQEASIVLGKQWRQRLGKLPKMDSASMKRLVAALGATKLDHPKAKRLILGTLIDAVKELSLKRDTIKVNLEFSVDGKRYAFASDRWHQTVTRSRISLMLEAFQSTKDSEFLDVFFAPGDEYPGLTLSRHSGGGFFAGDAQINGMFSRKAFDERVKPTLLRMPKFLKSLTIPKEERDDFSSYITQAVTDYADRYAEEYRKYYRSFHYRAGNLAALQYILAQLQLPSSPLKRFLADVFKNVDLKLDDAADNDHVEPMAKVPTTFAFLKGIVDTPKGGVSGLEGFGLMMGKLHGTLTAKTPFVVTDEKDDANALKARLTPVGRIALSIFRDDDDSEMKAVETWLLSANIRSDWRRPFLGPVRAAYRLGLGELNRAVKTTWGTLYADRLAPLQRSFPLAREAEGDVTPAQIEAALHPSKAFFKTFTDELAPLCRERQGQWVRRASRFTPVDVPRGMLALVNEMRELGKLFWDADGNPTPLKLRVKPMPLPLRRFGRRAAVLAYLQLGEKTIFAFNQRPGWQELPLSWWKVETATVGAVFAREGDGKDKKVYRNNTVAEAPWSFYRLMLSAEETERRPNLWNWRVPGPGAGQRKLTVQFRTDRNPWTRYQSLREKIEGARPTDGR